MLHSLFCFVSLSSTWNLIFYQKQWERKCKQHLLECFLVDYKYLHNSHLSKLFLLYLVCMYMLMHHYFTPFTTVKSIVNELFNVKSNEISPLVINAFVPIGDDVDNSMYVFSSHLIQFVFLFMIFLNLTLTMNLMKTTI